MIHLKNLLFRKSYEIQQLSGRTIWKMVLKYSCKQVSLVPLEWCLGEDQQGSGDATVAGL